MMMKETHKLLTKKRIQEIIEDFLENCDCEELQSYFKGDYYDHLGDSHGNEEEWIDNDSDDMKFDLIDNYLLQFGYHTLEEEGNVPSKVELIMNYLKMKESIMSMTGKK